MLLCSCKANWLHNMYVCLIHQAFFGLLFKSGLVLKHGVVVVKRDRILPSIFSKLLPFFKLEKLIL